MKDMNLDPTLNFSIVLLGHGICCCTSCQLNFKLEIKLKKNIIPNRDNRKKIMIKIPLLKIKVKKNKYNIIQQSFKVY